MADFIVSPTGECVATAPSQDEVAAKMREALRRQKPGPGLYRSMRKPRTYSDVDDALRRTAQLYRRAVFDELDVYIEVWLEKDALSGVLFDVTEEYDVPLMVSRGYSSLPFLRGAAFEIKAAAKSGKEVFLYNFGDHDPSGVDIARQIEEDIANFIDAPCEFERIAVTPGQTRHRCRVSATARPPPARSSTAPTAARIP
jgi:hypothetical protein